MVGAAFMALLVLGGVALMATVIAPDPVVATPQPAPVAPQPAVVVAPEPPAPPAAPTPSVLTLRTDPPGAAVWEGDTNHGLTPMELLLTGGPADAPRELELRLRGYASHTVRQPWTDQPVQHTVPLQKLRGDSAVRKPEPPPEPTLQVREER